MFRCFGVDALNPQNPAGIPSRILRPREVFRRVGLSRTTVYELARNPDSGFPKPIKLTEKATGFLEGEVEAWIAGRAAARGLSAKAA